MPFWERSELRCEPFYQLNTQSLAKRKYTNVYVEKVNRTKGAGKNKYIKTINEKK